MKLSHSSHSPWNRIDRRFYYRQVDEKERLRDAHGFRCRIVGAIIGGFIMRAFGFADQGGLLYTIFVAVIGAVLLTF